MSSSLGVDEAAIRAVEAAYDRAWQAGDIEGLLACLSEDAVLINPKGQVASGHAEIRRELAGVLGGPARGSKHTSSISRVEFVTADVAVVDGRATIDLPGDDHRASTLVHRFTDILVRTRGGWMIAHIRACAAITTAATESDPRVSNPDA